MLIKKTSSTLPIINNNPQRINIMSFYSVQDEFFKTKPDKAIVFVNTDISANGRDCKSWDFNALEIEKSEIDERSVPDISKPEIENSDIAKQLITQQQCRDEISKLDKPSFTQKSSAPKFTSDSTAVTTFTANSEYAREKAKYAEDIFKDKTKNTFKNWSKNQKLAAVIAFLGVLYGTFAIFTKKGNSKTRIIRPFLLSSTKNQKLPVSEDKIELTKNKISPQTNIPSIFNDFIT